ncbi:MAG: M4 family metallopeptidase [Pirellulales bacterium]
MHGHCDATLCQIIPPHMLESMAKSPNKKVRDAAISNIAAAERARAARATLAEVRPRMISALALGVSTKKIRVIHDAKRKPNLNGTVVRREGDSNASDKEVDEAYRFSGYVHDFYRKVFSRSSINNRGLPLKSSVRYREDPAEAYNNAFWWQDQMAYGDGDGMVFKRFTTSLDVVGHELTHGVVEYEANLLYRSESGALNESFADVFGSLIKQWQKNQTAKQADWLIGNELLHETTTRKALRSLKAPGTAYQNDPDLGSDPQPAHMDDKYTGFADNQGVHINSGIPNHAFYIAAVEIGGRAWEKAGRIWYDALDRGLKPDSDFEDCAKATYISAGMLYGPGSAEQKAVKKGWVTVGLSL